MQRYRGQLSESQYNDLSVRLELQADFYAGLWVHYAVKMGTIQLEEGDIESALGAANAVGDDTIQKQTQGYVYARNRRAAYALVYERLPKRRFYPGRYI